MDRTTNGSVLVAYALLQWPWRQTVRDHLFSFRRYGTRPYEYVNLAVPGLARAYAARATTPSSGTRRCWPGCAGRPRRSSPGCASARWRCAAAAPVHVALPQDEFLNSDAVNAFLDEIGVQHVFSVAPPSEWPKIYDGLDATAGSRRC